MLISICILYEWCMYSYIPLRIIASQNIGSYKTTTASIVMFYNTSCKTVYIVQRTCFDTKLK